MNKITRWIHKLKHKRGYSHKVKRFVDMGHDEQIESVKKTMDTINHSNRKSISLTENEMTIVSCALSVYLNLLRGYIR